MGETEARRAAVIVAAALNNITTYDRSDLIDPADPHLRSKLIEEMIIGLARHLAVSLAPAVGGHPIVTIPVSVLLAFIRCTA